MRYVLKVVFDFSKDISSFKSEIKNFILHLNENLINKDGVVQSTIKNIKINQNNFYFDIISKGDFRPHNSILQIKNSIIKKFGKKYQVGIRSITIKSYDIELFLDKEPKKEIQIPFAEVNFKGKHTKIKIHDIDEEFLRRNYIDRIIKLVKEKVDNQYYEGKSEFWKLIWESGEKKPIWTKDPTEEMVKNGWINQGPTKGKWFYMPQAAIIMKTMQEIALKEILEPLGFLEIIESQIVPFNIWLKTGHMEGMPGEFYYISEPKSRDVKKWEHFIDLVKITKEIPLNELEKNINLPQAGICYAQCPMIYWSFKGKTISEKSLPILVYDRTAISGRYESGGRHGIERVDEFHRIEPIYIGTKNQLLELRDKLIYRYKHVFNDIFDLEWRMAWVTPWYMQQAGKINDIDEQNTGTIDFEAYMPYRGSRKNSEWLEFQNLSIIGDKYIKSFNIKSQKSELWSGCSGIGLERWTIAFLAQKGVNPDEWPKGFKKYLKNLPQGIEFM
jgi:seryl-tRNA synthetase